MIERRKFIQGVGSAGLSSALFIGKAGAQSSALPVVNGVYAAPGPSFSAIFLAEKLGLWAKNGITTQLKQTQGGPLSMEGAQPQRLFNTPSWERAVVAHGAGQRR